MVTIVSHLPPRSVLSEQSATVSHSCEQKPRSPACEAVCERAHRPCAPPVASEPAVWLHWLMLPSTHAWLQYCALASGMHPPAHVLLPAAHLVPSAAPAVGVSTHTLFAGSHLRGPQSASCEQVGEQNAGGSPASSAGPWKHATSVRPWHLAARATGSFVLVPPQVQPRKHHGSGVVVIDMSTQMPPKGAHVAWSMQGRLQ